MSHSRWKACPCSSKQLPICIRPTEHSAFHVKASKGTLPVTNIATNKLVPNEKGIFHTELAVTSVSRDNKTTVT